MMNNKYTNLLIAILIALSMGAGSYGSSTANPTISIQSVQPNVVSNSSSVELVVAGADFVDGAQVLVENYGALSTTFVSATVLTASLPAGLNPGSYTISVVNPDSSSASLPNAIQVVAITQTAPSQTTPSPTQTVEVVQTQASSERPLVVIDSYSSSVGSITPNQEFDLVIKLSNIGEMEATNLIATFPPGDCVPRESGGVLATTELDPGERKRFNQPFTASYELWGKVAATIVMQVSYTDPNGFPYSETFNISIPVTTGNIVPTATPTTTPTATPRPRPQLVIPAYSTDVAVLQPGSIFNLTVEVTNKGDTNARRVTMILGGGSASGGEPSGTPDVSGISGGSGDFGNFAPVASSNVQFLGNLDSGASTSAQSTLIVNASINPGAYPLKITFTYVDDSGNVYADDQVITLLVYSIPLVDINFYREPDPMFVGQPGQLPLQVVNLGRKSVILGTMKASGDGAQYSNNSILVGALDVGGYFTLDAMAVPEQPGTLDVLVSVDYTDDFNHLQVITKTLTLDVQEMLPYPGPEGGLPEGPSGPLPETQPETLWQKVVRFLKGLLGLDSGQPTPTPIEVPPGEVPPGNFQEIQPVPSGKG